MKHSFQVVLNVEVEREDEMTAEDVRDDVRQIFEYDVAMDMCGDHMEVSLGSVEAK